MVIKFKTKFRPAAFQGNPFTSCLAEKHDFPRPSYLFPLPQDGFKKTRRGEKFVVIEYCNTYEEILPLFFTFQLGQKEIMWLVLILNAKGIICQIGSIQKEGYYGFNYVPKKIF